MRGVAILATDSLFHVNASAEALDGFSVTSAAGRSRKLIRVREFADAEVAVHTGKPRVDITLVRLVTTETFVGCHVRKGVKGQTEQEKKQKKRH
jgi:hypothetical protein